MRVTTRIGLLIMGKRKLGLVGIWSSNIGLLTLVLDDLWKSTPWLTRQTKLINANQVDKSPFAFAWNNPIKFKDPLGLSPISGGNKEICVPCAVVAGNFVKGAVIEASTQVIFGMASGKGFVEATQDIDLMDVAISGVEEAATGGFGKVGKVLFGLGAEIIQAGADVKVDGTIDIVGTKGSTKSVTGVTTEVGAAIAGKKAGELTESMSDLFINRSVKKELSKAKLFERNAATGSKNKEIGKSRVKDVEKTITGNKTTSAVIGHFTGEVTEEKIKN